MEGNDFSKLIKDVEGMPIEEWKLKYPNFYEWLIRNGFEYNKAKDKNGMENKAEINKYDTYDLCLVCQKKTRIAYSGKCSECGQHNWD